MTPRVDVAIVGGGVMGAACAERLAGAGLSVVLFEARGPAHASGSSHGDGRILRWTYGEPEYLAMARRAFHGWSAIEHRSGTRLVLRTGSWECGPADHPALEEILAGLATAEVPFEILDASESADRFPWLHLPEGWKALVQEDGCVVRAEAAVRALWGLAGGAGAETRTVLVREIRPLATGGFEVRTDPEHPPVRARHLVLAAGAWTRALAAGLGLELPLKASRETIAWFPPVRRAQVHDVGTCPTVIDYGSDPPFYALPRIDVPGVKVGWHRAGPELEPEPVPPPANRPPPPDALEPLQRWIGDRFPDLGTEPLAVETCVYTSTPDLHFVVDAPAEVPGLIVAGGFSGHGFKFAPVVAEWVEALVRGRNEEGPPPLFAIQRFEDPAGLRPRRGA